MSNGGLRWGRGLLVLASIMGTIGYFVERANGRTRTAALLFGVITLFVGLFVAEVKNLFAGH